MSTENFSTYTEVDTNNKLTVTTSKATAADADRDEYVYLYKDMTTDHFDALDVDFELFIEASSVEDGLAGVAITNTIGSIPQFENPDVTVYIVDVASFARILLVRGALIANDQSINLSFDTVYYCTLTRAAGNTTCNCLIYSDSGKTDLLDTLGVTDYGSVKWRYVYGFVNYNSGHSGLNFDGYTQNLDLNEVVAPTPVADGDLIGIPIIRKS